MNGVCVISNILLDISEIWHTVCAKLSWLHIRLIMRIENTAVLLNKGDLTSSYQLVLILTNVNINFSPPLLLKQNI